MPRDFDGDTIYLAQPSSASLLSTSLEHDRDSPQVTPSNDASSGDEASPDSIPRIRNGKLDKSASQRPSKRSRMLKGLNQEDIILSPSKEESQPTQGNSTPQSGQYRRMRDIMSTQPTTRHTRSRTNSEDNVNLPSSTDGSADEYRTDNDTTQMQSSATLVSSRRSSSRRKSESIGVQRTLRQRKPNKIYSSQYHPMDRVTRPNSKATLQQKHGITGSNGLNVPARKPTQSEKKSSKKAKVQLSSSPSPQKDDSNLLLKPLPQSWRDVSLFDIRLHGLQKGLRDEGPEPLPLDWFAVASKLIQQGFFTGPELEQWGGTSALKKRYENLRQVFETRTEAETSLQDGLPGYVRSLLDGESTFSDLGVMQPVKHQHKAKGQMSSASLESTDSTPSRKQILRDAAILGFSIDSNGNGSRRPTPTSDGAIFERKRAWEGANTLSAAVMNPQTEPMTVRNTTTPPASNINDAGTEHNPSPPGMYDHYSPSDAETQPAHDAPGIQVENPIYVKDEAEDDGSESDDSLFVKASLPAERETQ